MSSATLYQWAGHALEPLEYCDPADETIEAADSWLVSDGSSLALDLHRARFSDAAMAQDIDDLPLTQFWNAVLSAIPNEGSWFPRIELVTKRGGTRLRFRHRPAPDRTGFLTLESHRSGDPRTQPRIKGPDLRALLALRTAAQARGVDDVVILTPDGYIAEGATSSIVWWVDNELCVVDHSVPRIASVTERSLIALALALGITVSEQRARPADLDGREVWALNALHGPRIVTRWNDGPDTAELPARLRLWRDRLDALRKPLPRTA